MMRVDDFRKLLNDRILVLDGGMGSMLMKKGIPPGQPPEILNIERPEVVASVHAAYIDAGADIILTNTFGGNRFRLSEAGLERRFDEINRMAVRIARKCAGKTSLVAFSAGPSGKFMKPVGPLDFDDAYDIYLEQAKIAEEEQCDIAIIETMSDLKEAKAALIAFKDAFSGPVVAQMTFAEDGRTVTGTDALTAYTVLSSLGADGIGANCSVGPSKLEPTIKIFCDAGDLPVSVEPNAGIPILKDGSETYPEQPESFAGFAGKFAAMGVNLIGGCCGTTPDYISLVAKKLKGVKPKTKKPFNGLRVASRTKTFVVPENGCSIIGERINPSGRKAFSQKLKEGNLSCLREEAFSQMEAGAQLLDVNVGIPQVDEASLLKETAMLLESVCDAPLVLDSSNPAAIESALKAVAGKPIINSVNGEKKSLKDFLPLAKRYGASIIGLCLDENGIPQRAEERLAIGKNIVEEAAAMGISKDEIILDALTLPVSARAESAIETIKAIKKIRKKLKVKTVLGVSNISYGLPQRAFVSAAFLGEAVSAGLNFAIVNPLEKAMIGTVFASAVISGTDKNARRYIEHFSLPDRTSGCDVSESPLDRIIKSVIEGDKDDIADIIRSAMEKNISPALIVRDGLIRGMESVGERFEKGAYFLPQVILSAETMQAAFAIIRPFLTKNSHEQKGTVVFATVKADIHDIGKNICITLLENSGFKVVDLGKNVEDEFVLETAARENADIIALSALTTTTMANMERVIKRARETSIKAKIIVGGAVLNREYAVAIGADGYGKNGVECVRLAERFCKKAKE
jgi:5-methyltetrahydrofolate--homocysteine methyltransferase